MAEIGSDLRRTLIEKMADSIRLPIPTGTPRRVFGAVTFPGKATAVIGMRRAGKTTFVHQLRSERLVQGVGQERLPYLNFEDERLAGITADSLGSLVEEYFRQYPALRGRERVFWYFDEIQNVPGWERFVRRLLDSELVEIVVTGSSAALLSREIATALRGRAWEVVIHPFSFEEALRHGGEALPARPSFLSGSERSQIEHALLDWLQIGGFPEAQWTMGAVHRPLLRDYVDVAILRDVVERHQVTNVAGLRSLVRHLLGSAPGLFTVERLYSTMKSQGLAIAKDTVHQMLGYLEDCFLVRSIWMESSSERQRMVNPRKAYPVDTGLIPVYDRSGRPSLGAALETAVMVELERRRYEISYLRTPDGYEVDFLARGPAGELEIIQVAADLSSESTIERELRALKQAGTRFPEASKRLLTLTAIDGVVSDDVVIQPVYEWLLNSA